MKSTIEIFSDNLKALIKSTCDNYDEAASRCKIGRSTVDQLVGGKFNPSMEMIDKICIGLQCSPDQLFSDQLAKKRKDELFALIPRLPDATVGVLLDLVRDKLGLSTIQDNNVPSRRRG